MDAKKHLSRIWGTIAGAVAFSVVATAFADDTNTREGTPIVLAQAGSTGGTIGNQGKSVSGGEESAPARTPAVRNRHGLGASPRAPSCANFTGTWSWTGGLFGKNDTVFNTDGTARHRSGITGTWTCLGGGVIFVDWNWSKYKLRLSPDGRKLTGTELGNVDFVR